MFFRALISFRTSYQVPSEPLSSILSQLERPERQLGAYCNHLRCGIVLGVLDPSRSSISFAPAFDIYYKWDLNHHQIELLAEIIFDASSGGPM